MAEFDVNGPRGMAIAVAAHAAELEDRVAFAEAILPLMIRYRAMGTVVGYVTSVLPRNLPPEQWVALAEDHLAFLVPEDALPSRTAGATRF